MTVNTLLKNTEIEGQLEDYIRPFYEQGLDAVIVQDLGVMEMIHTLFPDMAIHASTQMTVCGTDYGKWLRESWRNQELLHPVSWIYQKLRI